VRKYLKYIVFHWTAGTYEATTFEKQFYHFLIDGDGQVHKGYYPMSANIPPLKIGQYAAHCGGGNSYAIGLGLCGMSGYKGPHSLGKYPLKRVTFEAACKQAAMLCKLENIPITPETVFTHYEYGKRKPNTTSAGKIDITFLPWDTGVHKDKVGDYIRDKVRWYLKHE
jgi:hypothetical protein